MIYFGACPKCHGDVTLNRDGYGRFLSCLQCGLLQDVASNSPVMAKSTRKAPVWNREEDQLPLAA